jgi:hypothetical protein
MRFHFVVNVDLNMGGRYAIDKADLRVFQVGCHWNACSHRDEFFMRNELLVPIDGVKLL